MSISANFKNGIVVIGAGNVATHMVIAMKKAELSIRCIYSRTIESAKVLAIKANSYYTNDLDQIPQDADIYIIAVKDEAIESLIKNIIIKSGIILHTAGSISVEVFKGKFRNYGVFYPLQTFTKSRNLDFSTIPMCIEGSDKITENKLFELAKYLSKSVQIVDSEKREILHLAAVFACNFANHMFSLADETLNQSGISFDLLKPLILETAYKAIEKGPSNAQTGPAVRNDQVVIQKHLEALKNKPELETIYRFMSDSIYKLNIKKNT